MKIAIIVNSFPPNNIGGTQCATYYMAKYLAQRGHEVHVITSVEGNLVERTTENGFDIHRLPWRRARFANKIVFGAEIVKEIIQIRPDVIHVQDLIMAAPALLIKRIYKIPYAVWGQGNDVYQPDWFSKLTRNIMMQHANAVLALTDDMKRIMQDICMREIYVVPNGIDLKRFKPSLVRKKERKTKKIIFVGRLHPEKGIKYLIEAMPIVLQEMENTELLIVGDGIERSRLEEIIETQGINDQIMFTGALQQKKIPEIMYDADVFVIPSLSESFGIVIIEAMAAGLPIIATNVGGIPFIIDEGFNGYLINPKRSDEIANKILFLLQNDKEREIISANNQKKALMFSWDMVAKKLENIYLSMLKTSKSEYILK